jgi:hypothetical protein
MDGPGGSARVIGTAAMIAGLLTVSINASVDYTTMDAYVIGALLTVVGVGLRIEGAIREVGGLSSPPEPTDDGVPGASTTMGS